MTIPSRTAPFWSVFQAYYYLNMSVRVFQLKYMELLMTNVPRMFIVLCERKVNFNIDSIESVKSLKKSLAVLIDLKTSRFVPWPTNTF